jgi:3-methyl-2-oxobutanoate hydroxymethyltransferase
MDPLELRKKMIEEAKTKKLVMLTAYDYPVAKILEAAGVDIILVGDSLGMVVLGYEGTKNVTMEDMVRHIGAVARGAKRTIIVGDMPIHSYDTSQDGLKNAKRFVEAGAQTVKIEGNKPEVIRTLIDAGIPVMGHLGYLPQTEVDVVKTVRGKEEKEAEKIFNDALELDRLGVFSIVLESMPKKLARRVTKAVEAPTIGIGAGVECGGQVLVINDMLGMDESAHMAKYVKRYAHLEGVISEAVKKFIDDVRNGKYPDEEHTYH